MRDMEENEKWKPHPSRENIFFNQEDVLRIQHISPISEFESESCNYINLDSRIVK